MCVEPERTALTGLQHDESRVFLGVNIGGEKFRAGVTVEIALKEFRADESKRQMSSNRSTIGTFPRFGISGKSHALLVDTRPQTHNTKRNETRSQKVTRTRGRGEKRKMAHRATPLQKLPRLFASTSASSPQRHHRGNSARDCFLSATSANRKVPASRTRASIRGAPTARTTRSCGTARPASSWPPLAWHHAPGTAEAAADRTSPSQTLSSACRSASRTHRLSNLGKRHKWVLGVVIGNFLRLQLLRCHPEQVGNAGHYVPTPVLSAPWPPARTAQPDEPDPLASNGDSQHRGNPVRVEPGMEP